MVLLVLRFASRKSRPIFINILPLHANFLTLSLAGRKEGVGQFWQTEFHAHSRMEAEFQLAITQENRSLLGPVMFHVDLG